MCPAIVVSTLAFFSSSETVSLVYTHLRQRLHCHRIDVAAWADRWTHSMQGWLTPSLPLGVVLQTTLPSSKWLCVVTYLDRARLSLVSWPIRAMHVLLLSGTNCERLKPQVRLPQRVSRHAMAGTLPIDVLRRIPQVYSGNARKTLLLTSALGRNTTEASSNSWWGIIAQWCSYLVSFA